MAKQVLMDKAGERMNVPAARVDEFLADGWVIIKRAEAVVPADVPLALPEPEPKPKAVKPKAGAK